VFAFRATAHGVFFCRFPLVAIALVCACLAGVVCQNVVPMRVTIIIVPESFVGGVSGRGFAVGVAAVISLSACSAIVSSAGSIASACG